MPPTRQLLMPKAYSRLATEVKNVNIYPNMHIDVLNDDLSTLRAMVIGPEDSPYEGGFFMFDVLPHQRFPVEPHTMYHQTTRQRVHPNLYAAPNGKVCLSILGTWGQREWSPILSLEKILLTIQGLMDNNPLTNEPGFELTKPDSENGKGYIHASSMITLSDCVLSSMERKDISDDMRLKMAQYYEKNKEKYFARITKLPAENAKYFHGYVSVKKDLLLAKFRSWKAPVSE